MKRLALLLLLILPVKAWSCSCGGTLSIEETIAGHPILVEAEVIGLEVVNTPQYGQQVHSATLRVNRILKGRISTETIVVSHLACYASLYPELMKTGRIYVLPLPESADGHHEMPGCSHSGMELIDDNLYTFEQATSAGRKLLFYEEYSRFLKAYPKP